MKDKDLQISFGAQLKEIEAYLESIFPGNEIEFIHQNDKPWLWACYAVRSSARSFYASFNRGFLDQSLTVIKSSFLSFDIENELKQSKEDEKVLVNRKGITCYPLRDVLPPS